MRIDEVVGILRVVDAIVRENVERAKATRDIEKKRVILRATENAVRWHVRGLFVSAFSEDCEVEVVPKKFEGYVEDMQRLDEELKKLGNRINMWSRKYGVLHKNDAPRLDENRDSR